MIFTHGKDKGSISRPYLCNPNSSSHRSSWLWFQYFMEFFLSSLFKSWRIKPEWNSADVCTTTRVPVSLPIKVPYPARENCPSYAGINPKSFILLKNNVVFPPIISYNFVKNSVSFNAPFFRQNSASLVVQIVKNLLTMWETWVWSGRSPGEGNSYLLQYSCLVNSKDRGAWRSMIHGVTESDMIEQHFFLDEISQSLVFRFIHYLYSLSVNR